MRPPDYTLIFLRNINDEWEGTVIIKKRISVSSLDELRQYLVGRKPADSDQAELFARKWLDDHGYDAIYPLYWEQVYL